MKKMVFISFVGISMLMVFICLNSKSNYLREDNILGIYLDSELQEIIPKKGEAVFSKAVCDNNATNIYWDIDKWGLFISNLSKKTKCNLCFVNYSGQTEFDFDYTGGEQTFTAPVSGTYRLETWGASGGYGYDKTRSTGGGGYGGFSSGYTKLDKNNTLYLNVGGQGEDNCETKKCLGGYNGGSDSSKWANEDGKGLYTGGGGGATHIALQSGLLSTFENSISDILIVSGGGGGGDYYPYWSFVSTGGSGGGFKGVNASGNNNESGEKLYAVFDNTAGTQEEGYSFGKAGTTYTKDSCGGSGGGYYGGISQHQHASGAGGSGYIENSLLTNKVMYCYNCEESNEESTKTISTTCSEETPTSNCAKKGNGYARITLVSID